MNELEDNVLDEEVTFGPNRGSKNDANESKFILNWNVIEEEPNDENGDESKENDEELDVLANVFLSRGQSELDIKRVGTCDGTDSTSLLKWLRTLDTTQRPIEIARATAIGPLATFLNKNKAREWRPLRASISSHFISASIQQLQRDALSRLEQRAGETLVSFNYEFEYLLSEAYSKLPEDQEELIRMYLSALKDRKLALSVLQDNPKTLEQAMRLAFKKNQTNDYLKPRTAVLDKNDQVKPVQNQLKVLTQALTDLAKSQEMTNGRVAQLHSAPPKPFVRPKESTRSINCFRCEKPGHFARNCRSSVPFSDRLSNRPLVGSSQSDSSPTPSVKREDKCSRCRSAQHKLPQCQAGPPSKPCFCGAMHWMYDCPHRRPNAQTAVNQGN